MKVNILEEYQKYLKEINPLKDFFIEKYTLYWYKDTNILWKLLQTLFIPLDIIITLFSLLILFSYSKINNKNNLIYNFINYVIYINMIIIYPFLSLSNKIFYVSNEDYNNSLSKMKIDWKEFLDSKNLHCTT